MIYFTADLHFNHDRAFVYAPRGFDNVEDMNETIIKNWNEIITDEDDIYVLGDLMLGDLEKGLECLSRLKGKIHIVRGNHDTDRRWEAYKLASNVVEAAAAIYLKYGKFHFYLTHFPCMTGNLEKESLWQVTCNLYGHTHQKSNFYNDIPFMYHVGVDSHNCSPISIDQILIDMQNEVIKCKEML